MVKTLSAYAIIFMRALFKCFGEFVAPCNFSTAIDVAYHCFTQMGFTVVAFLSPKIADMIGHGLQFLDGGYFLFHGLGFSLVPVRRVAFADAVKRREKSCVKDLQACLREASLMLVFCWLRHQSSEGETMAKGTYAPVQRRARA